MRANEEKIELDGAFVNIHEKTHETWIKLTKPFMLQDYWDNGTTEFG